MNNHLNNMGVPPDKQKDLINMAGKYLGKDPQYISQQIEAGNIQGLVSSLPPDQAAKLNAVLKNPQMINQLLNNPQILRMLGKK